MGIALFEEKGTTPYCERDFQVRLFDATSVKESGKTGESMAYTVFSSTPFFMAALACGFLWLPM